MEKQVLAGFQAVIAAIGAMTHYSVTAESEVFGDV
jgi:hypothetical protein